MNKSICGVDAPSPLASTKQGGSPLGQNGSVRIFATGRTPGRGKSKEKASDRRGQTANFYHALAAAQARLPADAAARSLIASSQTALAWTWRRPTSA